MKYNDVDGNMQTLRTGEILLGFLFDMRNCQDLKLNAFDHHVKVRCGVQGPRDVVD